MSDRQCNDDYMLWVIIIIAIICCFSATLVGKVLLCQK